MRATFLLTLVISAAIAVSACAGISASPAYARSVALPENLLPLAGAAVNLVLIIGMFAAMKRRVRSRANAAGTLKISEQRLQTVINSVQEGITFSDIEGKFEVFNRRMAEITGYTMEEANRSGDFTRLLYPDPADRQKALDGTKDVIEQTGPRVSETTITTKSGAQRLLHVSSQMVGADGNRMFLTTYIDVTEQRALEETLRIRKNHFERLFASAPEGIALLDGQGKVHEVNCAFSRMFGFSREEMTGRDMLNITVPEDGREEARAALESVMKGKSVRLDAGRVRKDGRHFDVSIIAVPVDNGRGANMAYVLYRDITQKKRDDREKEELIMKLQKALTDVKTLGGLLPICAWCKKIRDDQGYYHQIETFIANHSEVKFTHGICPECRERFDRDADAAPRELPEASG